jgi:predicted metalloprotease
VKLDDVDGEGFQIEDRRGQGAGGAGSMGGLGTILGGKGGKLGIPAIIVVVIGLLLSQGGGGGGGSTGFDDVLGQLQGQQEGSTDGPATADDAAQYEFVGDVGSLIEDFWRDEFDASGEAFRPAGLVIFDAPTDTGGCGVGTPEAGPFYCPPSEKMFIDFGFYEQLERQLGFDGDFAMAYVLAHEYGHHIQNLLGTSDEVRRAQAGASQAEANALSVKLELQADCYAGVWGRSAADGGRLDAGDFEEAIDAAEAVGDDSLQGSNANQESFTHGSSAERKRWFTTGFESGDPTRCDTFA